MLEIPKRLSLPAQVAAAIRKGIAENLWEKHLPGERRLSDLLHVSRPTVRAALHLLDKEGLLQIQPGKRNRVPTKRARQRVSAPQRLVILVVQELLSDGPPQTFQHISEMRLRLAEDDIATEIVVCQARGGRFRQGKLDAFLREKRVFCWVLISVGVEVQQWFAKRALPTLVLGSCHPSVQLPSIDVDHRAVSQHAANVFIKRGHRRLAFVVPNSGVAGDVAGEEGFCAAVESGRDAGLSAIVVRHDGTARSLTAKLDSLFNSDRVPTALLVAKPQHVFIVLMYFLTRGIRVPDQVSLIARDQDHVFESVSPAIAHYTFDDQSYVQRLSRLMRQMVDQRYLPPARSLIFPRFFAGGTIKDLA
jgi:DNA-binding LacI/PurR family transcriptional regulator